MGTTVLFVMSLDAAVDDELRELTGRLRDGGYQVQVRVSWEKGQAQRFVEEIDQGDIDIVVSCGGDGTLYEVLNGVMTLKEKPIVAGLPYGTGNDFLEGIGVEPGDGLDQFERYLDTSATAIDVGQVGGRYFLNMATVGAGAEISSEASSTLKDMAGSFAYFVRAIPAAFDIPTNSASVCSSEFEWEGKISFLFVGNGSQSGGGWRFCPAAKLDDGLLDVVIVPEMSLREMAQCGRELVKAESPGDFGPIVYRQLPEVVAEFETEMPINLDGEPFSGKRLEFCAEPRAIRFLLP